MYAHDTISFYLMISRCNTSIALCESNLLANKQIRFMFVNRVNIIKMCLQNKYRRGINYGGYKEIFR